MKIKVSRTGGFANITLNAKVDTATLSADKQTEVQNLFNKVKAAPPVKSGSKPDMYSYSLSIEDGEKSEELTATDETLSDDLSSLFDFVVDNNTL